MQDNNETKGYFHYVTSVTSGGEHIIFPAGKHSRMRLVSTCTTFLGNGGMLPKNDIKNILEEIKESMKLEIEPIFSVYKDRKYSNGHPLGFWSIPRLLFPEIDGLGRLRYGSTSIKGDSRCPVQFMKKYFPRSEYEKISDFIYNAYRHGLTHSHWPKRIMINDKIRDWVMILSFDSQRSHLEFPDKSKIRLNISAKDFYENFLSAIDKYMKEFDSKDTLKVYKLTRKFSQAYFKMQEPDKRKLPYSVYYFF